MREYGSEHPAIMLPDGYFKSFRECGREELFLRSGREALLLTARTLKAIQQSRESEAKDKNNVILLPAYCCWSMSSPFEKSGWKILYYRLNEDLTVNVEYLKGLLIAESPQAVLTMNFYGSAPTDEAVETVKNFNEKIVIIEDFSHCTFSLKQIYNPKVDIYVSSVRKSIGVCDGSIILSDIPMKKEYILEEIKDFADTRYEAQLEKKCYQWNNNKKNKQVFLKGIRNGESIIDEYNAVHPISERAKKMLQLVNGEMIAYARRENMRHLMRLLDGKVRIVPDLERCLNGAPFSFPILVENRNRVQDKLAKAGVYAPVLWPICEDAQKVCAVSKMMGEQMLSIPIDQRYNWHDIELIAKRILNILK